MREKAIVECVPNFSEGRDRRKIERIADAIRTVEGVRLLDVDPGADTNRTVYTFVGAPDAVMHAALAGAVEARDCIDMRTHRGAHPRIGALDVCPFVPVSGISMEECAALSSRFGKLLSETLGVPVYLYEKAATRASRTSLAEIRAGEYEGLEDKLADPEWLPDFGPPVFDPRWGATVAGAREFLIAYNINLNTRDKKLAQDIALSVREGGRLARNEDGSPRLDGHGNAVRIPGRLKAVRAIGWYIDQYRCAQVSMNLLDYRTTPLHEVFEIVKEEAERRGVFVTGSELIGLIPLKAITDAGRHFLEKTGRSPGLPDGELVEIASRTLGLTSVASFDAEKKVVEWAYRQDQPLVSSTLQRFADEVSSATPAPGGGSVSALAGSLAAALAAMVANLTVGKPGYEASFDALSALAVAAQTDKERLLDLVDEDTRAFSSVLDALRLPKATDAEKSLREGEIDKANRYAARVPLDTARLCLSAMRHCVAAMRRGNRSSVTDGAVGALLASAGLRGAVLNVRVNLASLKDEAFCSSLREETDSLEREVSLLEREMLAIIEPTSAA